MPAYTLGSEKPSLLGSSVNRANSTLTPSFFAVIVKELANSLGKAGWEDSDTEAHW
jgi:hypothetical protein